MHNNDKDWYVHEFAQLRLKTDSVTYFSLLLNFFKKYIY